MHVQLVIPKWSLSMPWVNYMNEAFTDHDFSVAPEPMRDPDVVIWGWCNKETVDWINSHPKKFKNIVYLRRYEMFCGEWSRLDMTKVDHLVFVNNWLKEEVMSYLKEKPAASVIYNGTDLSKWEFKQRGHGKNLAIVGYINQKKNFPLAMQILAKLGSDYVLHIAGEVQCSQTLSYISNFASKNRLKVLVHGQIPHEALDHWLEDKNYLLSTAISEGNPNNVIEAMAKGIKPLVHNWPGAGPQFLDCVFNTVDEAAKEIKEGVYDSEAYKNMVLSKFNSKRNYLILRNIAEDLCEKKQSSSV